MTQSGGRPWAQMWTALSSALASAIPTEEHLATEAVVAYVDGELSVAAHERATRHLAGCTLCTAEVAAQRQARAAVRSAADPSMPPSLLAALHAIPQSAELPPGPDGLAIGEDGQFVVAQRPLSGAPPLGLTKPLGSSSRLGSAGLGGAPLGSGRLNRRATQGAAVVVSGLVLGAVALWLPGSAPGPAVPGAPPAAETGGVPPSAVPARLEVQPRTKAAEADRPLTVAGRPQR